MRARRPSRFRVDVCSRRSVVLAAVLFVVGGIGPLGATESTSSFTKPPRVTYLANEGFLLEGGDRRVLIDALFGDGIDGYPVVPADARRALESATGPGAAIDIVVATHHHGDHFAADAVARFLHASPETIFVGPPQTIAKLVAVDADLRPRTRRALPAPGRIDDIRHHGIAIRAFHLHHGHRDPPVENTGYVITLGDHRFLHVGDTEATMDDVQPYLEALHGVDIALLPFWFLTSEWRIDLVRDHLQPTCIVAAHLPRPDAPARYFGRWESYANVVRAIREAFPDAWLPTTSGTVMPSGCLGGRLQSRPRTRAEGR